MQGETITVRGVQEDRGGCPGGSRDSPKIEKMAEWTHPTHGTTGIMTDLRTLGGLCVEVNARKERPWTMPRTIGEINDKLEAIGITSVEALAEGVACDAPAHINRRLRDAGQKLFSDEVIGLFRLLLLPPRTGAGDAGEGKE